MGRRALQHEWPAALAFVEEAAYSIKGRIAASDLTGLAAAG
jgi:hypothetical protein